MNIFKLASNLIGSDLFDDVKSVVSKFLPDDTTPEKKAEFELAMQQLQDKKINDAQQIALSTLHEELADVQDARHTHTNSIMPAVIVVMLTIMVCGLLYAVIFVNIRDGSRELAFTLFGTVFTLWGGSISYYNGTTRGSSIKSDIIAKSNPV